LDVLRKRVAPIAFILAMALLVQHTCKGQERTHATIVLDYGEGAALVRSVDATLQVDGELINEFHRQALPGLRIGESKFAVAMPNTKGQLTIDVDLGATRRHIMKTIYATEGATISVPLSADLR
jgi:hypothetical protein